MKAEHIELRAFSYFDSLRKRWVKGRYRASVSDIAARYQEYRIEGEPEIRSGGSGQFKPPTL